MNEFSIIFSGLYITLFVTPILAFALRKRFENHNKTIFVLTAFLITASYIAAKIGFSIIGVSADAIFIYFIYFLIGICVFKLTLHKNKVINKISALCTIPFIVYPFFSILMFFSIGLIFSDFETRYSCDKPTGYSCRVTSYGNATTSTGGYNAIVYKSYGFIEQRLNSKTVDIIVNPKITPESLCNEALSEIKSYQSTGADPKSHPAQFSR